MSTAQTSKTHILQVSQNLGTPVSPQRSTTTSLSSTYVPPLLPLPFFYNYTYPDTLPTNGREFLGYPHSSSYLPVNPGPSHPAFQPNASETLCRVLFTLTLLPRSDAINASGTCSSGIPRKVTGTYSFCCS